MSRAVTVPEAQAARLQQPAWPTFLRAMRLFRPHRGLLLAFVASIALASLVWLLPPLLIKRLIDHTIPAGDGRDLNIVVVIMLVAIAFGAVNSVVQTWLGTWVSQAVMFDLRNQLYGRLSSMSLGWFTRNRTGETLSRVNSDVGEIERVIRESFTRLVGNVVTLASTLALVAVLEWRLAAFAMLAVPLFLVPARIVGNKQRRLQRQTQEQLATMNAQMQETLSVSGILLMKTFGRQAHEASRFRDVTGSIKALNVRHALVGRWFNVSTGIFAVIGPAVVFWYGGHRVIEGDLTLGTVIAIAALLPRLLQPIAELLNVQVTVHSSLGVFERIFEYVDMEPEIQDRPDAVDLQDVKGELEYRNVGFAYQPGEPVLSDISLKVEPGRFAAFVGATGAGKTSLVNLVPRFYDVQSGQLLLDGRDVRDITLESLARQISIVSQDPFLFNASIMENLRYARPDATAEEVEAAARAANIHDFVASLPAGYETPVGEGGYRLSGGEKQRMAIARALLKDPAILILDEATSSVDAVTERAIQDAIDRVTRDRTVLAIAHRLTTVLAADVVFVLERGRVVESGTHAELMALRGAYARLYEHQLLVPGTDADEALEPAPL